jgi:hypothetical protein
MTRRFCVRQSSVVNSSMYRRLLLLTVALAFAPALLQATAAARSDAPAGALATGCGKKLVFLVWPKGHPAIPRIAEFPEIRNPHIELYRGFNSGYDVNAAGAYIVGGKPPPGIPRGGFFIACTNYGNPVTKGTVPKPSVTITKETAVKCTLPVSPVTDVVFRKGGVVDLYVHSGALLVAQGHVTTSSATLTVPSGRCTLVAPPQP